MRQKYNDKHLKISVKYNRKQWLKFIVKTFKNVLAQSKLLVTSDLTYNSTSSINQIAAGYAIIIIIIILQTNQSNPKIY